MTTALHDSRPRLDLAPAVAVARRAARRGEAVPQRTLKSSIRCAGIGLHSGAQVDMTLKPAETNTGIVFRRVDGGQPVDIAASWRNVVDTRMCTRIGLPGGPSVALIEHLMAALAGSEIDNALIEVDGPEVPIMDGSSAPFMFLIECAGTIEQPVARRALKILKEIEVGTADHFVRIGPATSTTISFDIDFESPVIRRQQAEVRLANGTFKSEISRARTFGFLHEIDQLHAAGLARGGSLDNAVVVSADGVMNEGGLRYDDEFVRHKMLDAVGDLYLAGGPLLGRFHGHRSGHHLHHAALVQLFSDPTAWRWVEIPAAEAAADGRFAATA
ncbi:MAG: UDP-3-O-acyl-N-acetylglucosamine deacetylase [Alphaproteobacteria bacterium]|nr:UDP-3-O-acyl-N-acetylglucosamine deacetylase [Alphaproteobacteria bacterium]